MKQPVRFARLLVLALAALAAAVPLAQVAQAAPDAPVVPDKIKVEEGNKVFLVGRAVGVQIYVCDSAGTGYAWRLLAPRADLYDDNGKVIVTHFGGPTWQATDGSKVIGQRVDAVTQDPSAIPWLLLSAASKSSGPDGDRLAATTFIQRVNTAGGLTPPAADCHAGAFLTQEEVPYTADYYFWKAQGT